ncbi:MAG: hypothetical protein M3384_03580 [Acidobacteriota bacterium]|nr:hypothetical protein [Acidobacteriota bacterium]
MQNTEFRTGVIRPVECFREGYELIKDQYWLFFAIVLVGMLIAGIIPFGLALGAMFCGVYYCMFQKMNGRRVEFEGLFKGFNYFVPGLVATLILIIPAVISAIFVYASMFAMIFASMDSRGNIDERALWGIIGTIFVEAIAIWLVLGSLHVFLMFAYPLIVERNMSGWEAFKLSARAGWANLSGVTGLILIEFVMGVAAYVLTIFLFGLGVYLVLPVMFAGVLVAYRKVFPAPQGFSPPPDAF